MNDLRWVIRRPLITEKGTALRTEENKYLFEVDKKANKLQIKQAVEEIFDVKVTRVRTMSMRGKLKRLGMKAEGRRPNWKKAVVTLQGGNTIEIFGGV